MFYNHFGFSFLRFIYLFALFAAVLQTAAASAADDKDVCNNGTTLDVIGACSRIIDSGKLTKNETIDALVSRGSMALSHYSMDAAEADFKKAIQLDETRPDGFAALCGMQANAGQSTEAIKNCDKALSIDQNSAVAFVNRAMAEAVSGKDLNKALKDCEKAMSLVKYDVAAFFDARGLIKLKQGNYKGSIEDYTKAIGLDPTMASSFFGRGIARSRIKAESSTDIAAANALQKDIADWFIKWGVK
jgi:tetratricopeptide (TPR) repeat protein